MAADQWTDNARVGGNIDISPKAVVPATRRENGLRTAQGAHQWKHRARQRRRSVRPASCEPPPTCIALFAADAEPRVVRGIEVIDAEAVERPCTSARSRETDWARPLRCSGIEGRPRGN